MSALGVPVAADSIELAVTRREHCRIKLLFQLAEA
jgi:hypothetical protein